MSRKAVVVRECCRLSRPVFSAVASVLHAQPEVRPYYYIMFDATVKTLISYVFLLEYGTKSPFVFDPLPSLRVLAFIM